MFTFRKIGIFILFHTLFNIGNVICEIDTSDRLIFAQIFYRHGDRNFIETYPNDPYADEKFWPEGFGELTNVGKREHYALGTFFRKRYSRLLGNGEYSPRKVYVRSVETDRSLMSAEVNLAALFPPKGNQIWNKHLDWQPVPIHLIPWDMDHFFAGTTPCARYDKLVAEYRLEYQERMFAEYGETFDYLRTMSGAPIEMIGEVIPIYDALFIEDINGFTLPEWTDRIYYPNSIIEQVTDFMFGSFAGTPEITRLRYGFLMQEVMDRFQAKIDSTLSPDRSLWIYSAHDISVGSVLKMLGLYWKRPPYASAIQLELYRTSDYQHYIQIFYKNSTDGNNLLEIPNCGKKCPFETFYSLYEPLFPTQDFESGCSLDVDSSTDLDSDESDKHVEWCNKYKESESESDSESYGSVIAKGDPHDTITEIDSDGVNVTYAQDPSFVQN